MDSTFKMEARSGKSLNLFTDCDHLCHVIHILYLDRIKKEKCSVPPYFLHHVQDAECDYGDLAKLHCDVTGQPDPKISWYKEEEGEPLCEYNGKYAVVQNCGHVILMIHDVTPDDIGCYTCKIRNDVGEARSTGRLFFSPAKKNQVPPSKGNHKKVIIEETVKIVERKSNPQENVSLLKQKLSHHKETEGIDTVAILFALPGGSSTKDMEVNAETGTGETYGDNVKPNDNGPGHRPCVVPCVATTASKEHTTTSSPTSSATSNSESVFDRDFDNDSSTCESSDEDLGKRVRWIETGENSDSEYRRGSIPYPMSLVPRRAQSDDTGIFSLPSAFERFSAKYSQSAGSDTTGSESTRTTPNGSDGSVDERMKKLTGLEPMRQISLASSYSSGSASSNMGVGTGVIGRTIRAMSQNEYFDTFFDEEQEVNGTEPNDTNALRHIFPVQPPLREIENENEDYPEVFDNVKNDAVIPSDANTCQSSLANAQCDVDVTSDFYKPNKSIGGHVETDEPTAFQEAYIDDLLTETEKTSSGNDIEDDEQNNKFQTEEPESNLAYHDDTIDVSTGQISIKSENISSDFFNNLNEELPFHHPISLRQLCEQQLAKPQRQIEAPCEDKTAKADALAVITRDLDVLIQTLLEFSERENVIVSSLKIGKPKRDEKDESSDGVVSISTVRPLKLALSSPQQQDEDEQNNVTQSQDVADKLAHQKPEFVISLEDMTLAWNQSTALNVSVTGCPEPTITWYCNGTPLDVDDDEVTNGIVANGEGTYMCVAKNTAGEATSSAKLIVTNTKQEKSASTSYSDTPTSFPHKTVKYRNDKMLQDLYDVKDPLGSGRFGKVWLVEEKGTGGKFAAKQCACRRPSQRKEFELEIEIMNELKHPKLLHLYDAFFGKNDVTLVLELVTGGELFDRIADDSFDLTEQLAVTYLRQICEAISYMHSVNILHLDLKPENILCLNPERLDLIKIIDFGFARRFTKSTPLKIMFGTPEFVAPEVVNFDPLGKGTDVWSIGVITYVLLSGLSPFMGENEQETLSNVTACEVDFDEDCFDEVSNPAKNFMKKLLTKQERKRPTCEECLDDEWLRKEPSQVSHRKSLAVAIVNLKKFVSRRKWMRSINAVRALNRLQAGLKKNDSKTDVNANMKKLSVH